MSFTIQEATKVLSQKFLMQEGIAGVSHHSQELVVYVETPEIASKIPRTLMGYPVKTVVSGKFRTLSLPSAKTGRTLAGILGARTERWRPIPGGVSIGSVQITAGTNAGRVIDLTTGRKMFLCYSADTRVLTKNGFKYFYELSKEDEIATLNIKTGYLEYQHPSDIYCFKYSGKLIRFVGKSYDLLVTPNHRMLVRTETGKIKFMEASQLADLWRRNKVGLANWSFLRSAKWEGESNSSYFELAVKKIKCGYSSTIGITDCGKYGLKYSVLLATHTNPRINGEVQFVDYDGYVYCVSVPNETLLVERNGKIVWSGNSNRHVFYGDKGTPIVQPGVRDGGSDPGDRVAAIERWVELKPPPDTNLVDAALGLPISQDLVSDEVLDIGLVNGVAEARVGMRIKKSGRSCGLAEATITDVNATVKVEGYEFGEAIFEDTIISTFCGIPGDSGSIAVSTDTNAAVGLLFAGSDSLTCFNKMTNVVKLLNVDIPKVAPVRAPPTAYVQFPVTVGLALLMASQKTY